MFAAAVGARGLSFLGFIFYFQLSLGFPKNSFLNCFAALGLYPLLLYWSPVDVMIRCWGERAFDNLFKSQFLTRLESLNCNVKKKKKPFFFFLPLCETGRLEMPELSNCPSLGSGKPQVKPAPGFCYGEYSGHMSKWLLSPHPCLKHERFFSYSHLKNLVRFWMSGIP